MVDKAAKPPHAKILPEGNLHTNLDLTVFSGKINQWLNNCLSHYLHINRLPYTGILLSISVSLSASLITVPISAYYFGTISLVSVLTNILTIWAVSVSFVLLLFVCLLGFFLPAIAAYPSIVIAWLLRYVLTIAKLLSSFRFSALYTQSIYVVIWLVFVYISGFITFTRKRKPIAGFLFLSVTGMMAAVFLSVWVPTLDAVRLTVMDVGEGQCILLQSKGENILIDCGGSDSRKASDTACQTLLSQGIQNLNAVILTHYDSDHAGGITSLLTRIHVDTLYGPVDTEQVRFGASISSHTEMRYVSENTVISFGVGELSLFSPQKEAQGNEKGLCILFTSEECAILITGDYSTQGESWLLEHNNIPDVDILIVGHHGSKYSTGEQLLAAVRPETAVISVGSNTYGHPAEQVLQRLSAHGCNIYRTDELGSVLIRRP